MPGKAILQLESLLVYQKSPFMADYPTDIHPVGMVLTPEYWGFFQCLLL